MTKRYLMIVILYIIIVFTLSGCNTKKQKDDHQKLLDQQDTAFPANAIDDSQYSDDNKLNPSNDKNIITWGVPDIYQISNKAINSFNERLHEMGYNFSLKFIKLDFFNYKAALEAYENRNGSLDISFSGTDQVGEKERLLKFIKSGYFMPLNELLNTEAGKQLYELYDVKLWESVKVDGNIYTIPNGVAKNSRIAFAFNKAYVTKQEFNSFTGDLSELVHILEKVPPKDNFSHFVCGLENDGIFYLLNCDYRYGLLLLHDKRQAVNPYEYDVFRKYLELLNDFKEKQYLNYNYNISNEAYVGLADKFIENGSFVVYIGSEDELPKINTDVYIYYKTPYVWPRLVGTGIAQNSNKKEDAFKLLTLAYTDKELANLLVYGLEGTDYMLKDGVAYNLDGEVADKFLNQLSLGIYEMTYPNSTESFKVDRYTDKKNYYANIAKASPYLGFNFYDENFIPILNEVNNLVLDNLDIWKSNDLDAEFERVNAKLEKAGINELITAVNEQLNNE